MVILNWYEITWHCNCYEYISVRLQIPGFVGLEILVRFVFFNLISHGD